MKAKRIETDSKTYEDMMIHLEDPRHQLIMHDCNRALLRAERGHYPMIKDEIAKDAIRSFNLAAHLFAAEHGKRLTEKEEALIHDFIKHSSRTNG